MPLPPPWALPTKPWSTCAPARTKNSIFKATISYFPERYGQYLVPAIVDMLEGKTVPESVIPAVSPVTRENVNELYPAQ